MTKTIQSMPEIWNNGSFLVSKEDVLGALACWAVKQSPYIFPKNLEKGLKEFEEQFGYTFVKDDGEFFETSCNSLRHKVRDLINGCPVILEWNKSKKGNGDIAFVSRYDKPEPDFDFIDLDALARNIAQSVTLQAKYDQLHN